jgi:hypothetical protein
MKNNVGKILGYAAIALAVLILISFLAGFLAWIWGKLVIGFVAALVIWLVQKARSKPTDDGFVLWWGIGISVLLITIDLATMFIARFAWLIFVALIIGVIIWVYKKKSWFMYNSYWNYVSPPFLGGLIFFTKPTKESVVDLLWYWFRMPNDLRNGESWIRAESQISKAGWYRENFY